jgi:steroid 5-alpha reductase family enzyme
VGRAADGQLGHLWPAVTVAGRGLGWLDALAALVTLAAVATEAMADVQLRAFVADPAHRGAIADRGLWSRSRHPNYLGQIGLWWGLWLFALAADPGWWWTVVGPAAMVALFVLVSVPLMDARSLERRPGYEEHMRAVGALVPRPARRRGGTRDAG